MSVMSVTQPVAGEVFIVDDDPLVLNALTIVLSREGYQVTGFGEGASFLAAAKARTPTCIILDVQMPGQSGLDILRELNAQQYAAPIFIISGIGDIPMAVEAIKNGALDFIEKPFDASTVVTRVNPDGTMTYQVPQTVPSLVVSGQGGLCDEKPWDPTEYYSAYDAYQASLARLRSAPTDPKCREQALHFGRISSALARGGGYVTTMDEVSIANDVNTATGGSGDLVPRPDQPIPGDLVPRPGQPIPGGGQTP